MASYPQLTYWYPQEKDGDISALRPNIVLDWSTDIEETQFSDAASLRKFVTLLEDDTSTPVPLEYVSYTPTSRRIILKPASDLARGATYRILVKRNIKDSTGRSTVKEYNWIFTTTQDGLGKVALDAPADSSIYETLPTFSWLAVSATGTVEYEFQLDDSPYFTSLDYTSTGPGLSVAPMGALPSNTSYFWRVRALTTGATGAWSDPRSLFYGTLEEGHITSQQKSTYKAYTKPAPFAVSSLSFDSGLSNQMSWPRIELVFSSDIATGSWEGKVRLEGRLQVPRNDEQTSYLEAAASGSWELSGNKLTFTPSGAMLANTRYELEVDADLEDVDGRLLGERYRAYFTSRYAPYYADIRSIKAKLRMSALTIPDDLINFEIHQSSLAANTRYYLYVSDFDQGTAQGDDLLETSIRDLSLKSAGVRKWVEANTIFELLRGILLNRIHEVGLSRKLMDYSESLSEDFLKAIELAMKQAKEEVEYWEMVLAPNDLPRSVSRYSGWDPRSMDYDLSIRDLEARRGHPDWMEGYY